MTTTSPNQTPAAALAALVAAGVAAYEASLPDFARGPQESEEPLPVITLSDELPAGRLRGHHGRPLPDPHRAARRVA
jgi:hypothetical protein